MNILVAYESSGTVREAFRKAGHNAWSCDLQAADDGSNYHLQGDVEEWISDPVIKRWDLIVMHPPCTALAVSGNAHYGTGKAKHQQRIDAIEYTLRVFQLAKANADRVCMENPVGVLPIKASQYIQPYEHGHAESKKTGLWLHNLPKLRPTNVLDKPACGHWDNQTPSGQNKLGPSPDRWKIRSKTYTGIAQAIADQWGDK
ncbi:MAG: hypothetical protein P8L17_06265 [Methylophilaceae bacterium]|nr:hypothetical protein [Methylophilaceae bacterium]